MIASGTCVLFSQDPDLVRRTRAYLRSFAQVRHVSEIDRLDSVLEQSHPALLLLDLRSKESRPLLSETPRQWPDLQVIALGTLRSEPLREAAQAGIYAAEDVNLERRQFQALVSRAFDHLYVVEENRQLRGDAARLPGASERSFVPEIAQSRVPALAVSRLPQIFRQDEGGDILVRRVVEGLAQTARVGRVGLFSRSDPGTSYRLRAGLRCLPETGELEYHERDPLVRWFEANAHLVSRDHLPAQRNYAQRELLRRALDSVGAEVLVPLYREERISGWLFFGHRVTGQPFSEEDLEMLMVLGEQVSSVLEDALAHEEVCRQKTLAETLLAALPPAIIACDENGLVRWCNPSAESLLGLSAREIIGRPVENAGSRIASFLRETLDSRLPLPAQQWIDEHSHRSISVQGRRLQPLGDSLGAVAVIQDVTSEESMRQKQELMDRAAFWTDLAASMSHEVRNPLVAIKTFAQLLPERFEDSDFRRDFNEIVVQEIDRLDLIITQINDFAHPPELHFKPLDLRAPMKKAIELVRARSATNGFSIETTLPDDLPQVVGDETALTEAFAHLVANAAEATNGRPRARITLSAKPIREGDHASGVVVTVHDNGAGIAEDLRDKIFSPFCTTKARGMGLGLPIVKRTVFDHNGRVEVDSNAHGTSVSVLLPVAENGV